MKNIITTIVFVALTAITANAQFTRHEFSLHGAGGISTLKYDANIGDPKTGFGFNTGLGYTFFFSSNWGIGTGVEFSLMNTKYELSKRDLSYTTNDGTEDFELRHTINGYTENQQAMAVNIPLMLKYQTNGNTKFYAALGGKIGFPVKATYKNKAENISVSGYYPQYDNELFDPEFMGFGEFEVAEKKNDLSLKAMFMLSAEAGVKWRLSESWSLYTGAYIDYGLHDILNETQENQLLVYNNQSPTEYSCNSMLASRYTEAGNEKVFTDKVIPFSVGLKVALAFGKTPKVKQEQSEAVDTQAEEKQQAEEARLKAEQEALEAKRLADEEAVRLAAQETEAKRKAEESARAESARQDSLKKETERRQYEIKLQVGNYPLDGVVPSEHQKSEIDLKITQMKSEPKLHAIITGHTCDMGTDEFNIQIGQKRADHAKEYMVEQGIDPSRIETASKGSKEPFVPNTSKENRLKNRRIEIITIEKK